MKLIFLLLMVSSTASALDLPKGSFVYEASDFVLTKHFHRLFQKNPDDKKQINVYRGQGYSCKRQNSNITDCSKLVSVNPHEVVAKTKNLASLSPKFSDEIEGVEEISSGDAATVYEITQEHSTESTVYSGYRAYEITNSGFYVDLLTDQSRKIRFEFIDANTLTRFSYQKEKLSKREHLRHSLISTYKRKN